MSDRYLIVIEGNGTPNFSAYSPDLPGCVATGETREECETAMREAIALHIEALLSNGELLPPSTSTAAYVDV